MKSFIFGVLIGMFLLISDAVAWDAVDSTTVTTYHSYTEPTENTDGTPLTDLHHINVYFSKSMETPLIKLSTEIPATSLSGGGFVALHPVNVPIDVGENVTARFALTAVTVDGRESEFSTTGALVVARPLPDPNAPTGFTVN